MQRLEVSGAVRPIYGSLGVKRLMFFFSLICYKGAQKSLARPGRKQDKSFCQNGVNFLRRLALQGKKKLDDISRLDVVEIARVLDMLPSLFPSWSS